MASPAFLVFKLFLISKKMNTRPDVVRKIIDKNKKKDRPEDRILRDATDKTGTGSEARPSKTTSCEHPESHVSGSSYPIIIQFVQYYIGIYVPMRTLKSYRKT